MDPQETQEIPPDPSVPALVVVAYPFRPERVGEVFLLRLGDHTIGRGPGPSSGPVRARPARQRPGNTSETEPLQNPKLSRNLLQLHVDRLGDIRINAIGKNVVYLNGWEVEHGHVQPGDLLSVGRQLVLYCTRRNPTWDFVVDSQHDWGAPDPWGTPGESEQMWLWRAGKSQGLDQPIPSLDLRKEDVPFLLQQALARNPDAARYLEPDGAHYLVSPELICALIQQVGEGTKMDHVVDQILAENTHPAQLIENESFHFVAAEAPREAEVTRPADVDRDMLEEAMLRHGGLRERVWRDLNLRNRSMLARLLRKHGLV